MNKAELEEKKLLARNRVKQQEARLKSVHEQMAKLSEQANKRNEQVRSAERIVRQTQQQQRQALASMLTYIGGPSSNRLAEITGWVGSQQKVSVQSWLLRYHNKKLSKLQKNLATMQSSRRRAERHLMELQQQEAAVSNPSQKRRRSKRPVAKPVTFTGLAHLGAGPPLPTT